MTLPRQNELDEQIYSTYSDESQDNGQYSLLCTSKILDNIPRVGYRNFGGICLIDKMGRKVKNVQL